MAIPCHIPSPTSPSGHSNLPLSSMTSKALPFFRKENREWWMMMAWFQCWALQKRYIHIYVDLHLVHIWYRYIMIRSYYILLFKLVKETHQLLLSLYIYRVVGGFNPSEKYKSKWVSSPSTDENKKCLKPPPSRSLFLDPGNPVVFHHTFSTMKGSVQHREFLFWRFG